MNNQQAENLRSRRWPTIAMVFGLLLLPCGFIYQVMFAGIPYPDPTPELTERYAFHSRIAVAAYATGVLSLLLGICGAVVNSQDRYSKRTAQAKLRSTRAPEDAPISRRLEAFDGDGRVGRVRYASYLAAYLAVLVLATAITQLWLFAGLACFVSYCFVTVGRLHDIGLSGWYLPILGLPAVNVLLLFLPGHRADNRFGEPPPRPGAKGAVELILALLVSVAAISLQYLLVVQPANKEAATRAALNQSSWSGADVPVDSIRFTSDRRATVVVPDHEPVDAVYEIEVDRITFTYVVGPSLESLVLTYRADNDRLRYESDAGLVRYMERAE